MQSHIVGFTVSLLVLGHAVAPLRASAQDFHIDQLPVPGVMVPPSRPAQAASLTGLTVNPHQPLEFQFLIDTGNGSVRSGEVREDAERLVRYFLAGLAVPSGDLWVNLSPYEQGRIVPHALGETLLGRDLLAQDYVLKQVAATMIYPESGLGKQFWSRLYTRAKADFGTTAVPISTYNKVWIVPGQAQVYERGRAVYITKATLKVMLDDDYMASSRNPAITGSIGVPQQRITPAREIMRTLILPALEKEVNSGENFATLRQAYQALILAKWYRETVRNDVLDTLYDGKNKIKGIDLGRGGLTQKIYARYVQAYKKGVFNYIRAEGADMDRPPRRYFSGGISDLSNVSIDRAGIAAQVVRKGAYVALGVLLTAASAHAAQLEGKAPKDVRRSAIARSVQGQGPAKAVPPRTPRQIYDELIQQLLNAAPESRADMEKRLALYYSQRPEDRYAFQQAFMNMTDAARRWRAYWEGYPQSMLKPYLENLVRELELRDRSGDLPHEALGTYGNTLTDDQVIDLIVMGEERIITPSWWFADALESADLVSRYFVRTEGLWVKLTSIVEGRDTGERARAVGVVAAFAVDPAFRERVMDVLGGLASSQEKAVAAAASNELQRLTRERKRLPQPHDPGKRKMSSSSVNGGIDFNPIPPAGNGRRIVIHVGQAQLREWQARPFSGFVPHIIYMAPVAGPVPLNG